MNAARTTEFELDSDTPTTAAPRHRTGIAKFAIGSILMLAAVVLLAVAMGGTFYQIDYRLGPQPDGADSTGRTTVAIDLATHTLEQRDGQGTLALENTESYRDSPVGTGETMQRLRFTTIVALGLIALAFLAALLHRFGALNLPGPAPVLALFGTVLLLVGLVPFVRDIAHHAWLDWGRGLLDTSPAFFTVNLDGTQVHDLVMGPGLAFWLHVAATALAPVGAAFVFWDPLSRLGRGMRTWAETAAA